MKSALRLSLVVALALGAACREPEPSVVSREIVLHAPASCAVEQASGAYAIYKAYGDFQTDPPPAEDAFLSDVGQALPNLPPRARALAAEVLRGDFYWLAYGEIPDQGPVDLLLWRAGSACALTGDLGRRTAPAFGVLDPRHVLLAGGKPDPGAPVPDGFVADLATGRVRRMDNGLLTPRAGASVTPFGSGALVAGGRDIDSNAPLAPGSAEVYAPAADGGPGGFDGKPITINARADHAAIAMASGETLLVGGVGADGKPLASLEIVDPVTRRARTGGLAQLQIARTQPSVVRLANGEILVGGGRTLGADGKLVAADRLEFLAPDAQRAVRKAEPYRAGRETKLVALPAGGALMINAGEITDTINTVYVVSADGRLDLAPENLPKVDVVRLFDGFDGAPVLWTGDRWLRWKPWIGEFEAHEQALSARPGPPSDAIVSPDAGLALWLADGGSRIAGVRFDREARGRGLAYVGPYSLAPPTLVGGVEGLSPDRLINARRNEEQALRFNKQFGLTLDVGASAFVTDATFAAFALDADIPTGTPPLFVLREPSGVELEVGGPDCPFDVPAGAASHVRIDRDGATVQVRVDDGPPRACARRVGASVRMAIGIRGRTGPGRSAVRNLAPTRR